MTETSAAIDSNDTALLLFTAGTTAPPKLVPLTHRNIIGFHRRHFLDLSFVTEDVTLLVMPLFHGHGLIGGAAVNSGERRQRLSPEYRRILGSLVLADIVRLGVTWYTAVPTIHRILLNRASHEYPGSSRVPLRFIRSCSAPLDEELAAATAVTFRAPMISAYGMTETSHQVSSNPLPVHGSNKIRRSDWPLESRSESSPKITRTLLRVASAKSGFGGQRLRLDTLTILRQTPRASSMDGFAAVTWAAGMQMATCS